MSSKYVGIDGRELALGHGSTNYLMYKKVSGIYEEMIGSFTETYFEKRNSFGTALSHNKCIFRISRKSESHDDEKLYGSNEEKFRNFVRSIDWERCSSEFCERA